MLGAQQSVSPRAAHDERDALQAGLLTGRLVDDLSPEPLALRPLQVHAEQHLDPVLGLDAPLPHRDRDHGVVRCVLIREQQVELARPQLRGHRRALLGHLLSQLGIVLRQLVELHEVASAPLETVPSVNEVAVLRGLARELTRVVGIVPDAGLG